MHVKAGRFLLIGAVSASLLGLAGCGGDKTGGPAGAPGDIVGRAPDATLAARTAQILITAPAANGRGVIDMTARRGRLAVLAIGYPEPADVVIVGGAGYAKPASGTTYAALGSAVPQVLQGGDPWAAIDVIRGTAHILSNGGGEVEGASTIGYTVTIDPRQAIGTTPVDRQASVRALLAGRTTMFKMNIWIDSQFRLRRIEVPADFSFKSTSPPTRVDGATIATDVDFVTFGVPAPAVADPLIVDR